MRRFWFSLLASTALLFPEVAQAEPISAAIGLTSLIGSAFGISAAAGGVAAAVGGFIVSTVVGVGLSLGLGLLSKSMQTKPKAGQSLTGVETSLQIGGDVPRQICVGTVGVRGQLVFHNTMGGNNEFHQRVYVLSDWISDSLLSIILDGKKHSLTTVSTDSEKINYTVSDYPGVITLTLYKGTQAAADLSLISLSNPVGRWTTDSVLKGLTYVIVYYTYQQGAPLFENGIPDIMFELKGARLYDWRLDSTNGGSGAHRWDDPGTWAYSDNPVVAAYNFQRGFFINGERIIGMGMTGNDIILSTYTAAANICDELVPLDVGGTEKRYRCSIILSADEGVTYGQTLDVLQSTFAGYFIDYQGFYYCSAGGAQASTDTITDDELVIGLPVQVARKRSRSELYNRVHGQFLDTSSVYDALAYTAQVDGGATTNDGEELGKGLDLLAVPSRTQAERIAKIKLRECRLQTRAVIPLGFNHLDKQVGDWITWNSTKWGNRIYKIVNRKVDTRLVVTLELEEIAASVFSWTALDEGVNPQIGLIVATGNRVAGVSAFTVQAFALTGTDGSSIPALKFSWAPITDSTVDAVIIEYRKIGTTTETIRIAGNPGEGSQVSSSGVRAGTDFEARATITTTPARVTVWTAWISVLTGPIYFNLASAVGADVPADIPTGLTLSSVLEVMPSGETQTVLTADWSDVTGAAYYQVDIKEGSGGFVTFNTGGSIYIWRGIRPGTFVTVRVRSMTRFDAPSGYTAQATHTVIGDTTPTAAIVSLNGSASFQTMWLWWVNPPDKDFAYTNLHMSSSNSIPTISYTVGVAGEPGSTGTHTVTGVPPGATRFFWVQPYDSSGNPGPITPAGTGFSLTSLSIISADIAAAAIDQTKFANSLRVPDFVSALPSSGNWLNRIVILISDQKSYKWNGSSWARAYSQDIFGVDNIQATSITAGAVGANQIAARAITTEKLAVGSRNVAFNAEFNVGSSTSPLSGWTFYNVATGTAITAFDRGPWAPTGFSSVYSRFPGTPSGNSYWVNSPVLQDGTGSRYAVSAGQVYEASVALSLHRCSAGIVLRFWDASGTSISSFAGNFLASNGASGAGNGSVLEFPRSSVMGTAPAGAVTADIYIQTNYDGVGSECHTFVSALFFGGTSASALTANAGGPAFAPYQTPGITIIERGQIRTGEVVTEHMVANTIEGDRIRADSLHASKVMAGTVMSGTVIVNGQYLQDTVATAFDPVGRANVTGGSLTGPTLNGTAIPTVVSGAALGAQDPATRINANTTQIGPGNILISGGTTLSNWRHGGDLTQIAGGAIGSNTIEANKVKIGVRGLQILAIDFSVRPPIATSNIVDWTAGYISYTDDNGNAAQVFIPASGAVMSLGGSVFWTKGTSYLQVSNVSYGGIATGDNVILATYLGGGLLNVMYGGTIIDGSRITTGTVLANRITAGTITATEVLQSAALVTNSAMIADLTVGTLKIIDGDISSVYAASGSIGYTGRLYPPLIYSPANRRFLVSWMGIDTATPRNSFAGFGAVSRPLSFWVQKDGVDIGPYVSSYSWDSVVGFGVTAAGQYNLAFPNIVGQYIYTAPSAGYHYFMIQNDSGLTMYCIMTVTELKR